MKWAAIGHEKVIYLSFFLSQPGNEDNLRLYCTCGEVTELWFIILHANWKASDHEQVKKCVFIDH